MVDPAGPVLDHLGERVLPGRALLDGQAPPGRVDPEERVRDVLAFHDPNLTNSRRASRRVPSPRPSADRGEARLRLRVGVVQAGLPAVEVGLVEEVEDETARSRSAGRPRARAPARSTRACVFSSTASLPSGESTFVYEPSSLAGIATGRRTRVVRDRELRARLRGAVERRRRGARRACRSRRTDRRRPVCGCSAAIAERVWYGWSAKTSMIGFVAAAGAVRGAHVADELRRRVRRPRGVGVCRSRAARACRRRRLIFGRDGLERVVGAREQRRVGGRGDVLPAASNWGSQNVFRFGSFQTTKSSDRRQVAGERRP